MLLQVLAVILTLTLNAVKGKDPEGLHGTDTANPFSTSTFTLFK